MAGSHPNIQEDQHPVKGVTMALTTHDILFLLEIICAIVIFLGMVLGYSLCVIASQSDRKQDKFENDQEEKNDQ